MGEGGGARERELYMTVSRGLRQKRRRRREFGNSQQLGQRPDHEKKRGKKSPHAVRNSAMLIHLIREGSSRP